MPATPLRDLISLNEAASIAGVHPRTIRRWIIDGRLAGYRAGPKLLRVKRADVNKTIRPVTIGG